VSARLFGTPRGTAARDRTKEKIRHKKLPAQAWHLSRSPLQKLLGCNQNLTKRLSKKLPQAQSAAGDGTGRKKSALKSVISEKTEKKVPRQGTGCNDRRETTPQSNWGRFGKKAERREADNIRRKRQRAML